MDDKDDYYRLILVDDEDEVRGRISSKISEESGFIVVGTAGNGHDALELIDKHAPHAVITDIRMPFIDGIELASILKREYPTIRVAFITGYDEFDYAREAVELGVRSYLTKPLTQGDISRFLDSLKLELDEEFRQASAQEAQDLRYRESLPFLIDSYFSSILSDAPSGADASVRSLENHGIVLEGNAVLILIQVEEGGDTDVFRWENRKLLIRSAVRDILKRRHLVYRHFLYHGGIVFLVRESRDGFSSLLDEALMEAVQTSRMYHAADIDIGVSAVFRGFGEMRNAYLEARRALDDSRFLNTGRIVYIEQLEGTETSSVLMSEQEMKSLDYIVRFGGDAELKNAIASEKKKISLSAGGPSDFRLYMLRLVNIVVGFSTAIGVDITELNGGDVLDTVNNFGALEPLFAWFEEIALKLREHNSRSKRTNSDKMLVNAIAYLAANYQNTELSMESACEFVGISVSYLSLLFKKNTGGTFVSYLTGLRIDKAKELLKYSDDRIIEIAEKCGYKDVYYFSHSFKKHVGIPPKKYRENQKPD